MITVNKQWELFEKIVISKEAPLIQRQEMKKAFYAGVKTFLVLQMIITETAMNEEEKTAFFATLADEINNFVKTIN